MAMRRSCEVYIRSRRSTLVKASHGARREFSILICCVDHTLIMHSELFVLRSNFDMALMQSLQLMIPTSAENSLPRQKQSTSEVLCSCTFASLMSRKSSPLEFDASGLSGGGGATLALAPLQPQICSLAKALHATTFLLLPLRPYNILMIVAHLYNHMAFTL